MDEDDMKEMVAIRVAGVKALNNNDEFFEAVAEFADKAFAAFRNRGFCGEYSIELTAAFIKATFSN